MHDKNGLPLALGDTVTITAVIIALQPGEDYCNVSLETVDGRRPDGKKEQINGINTGVLELRQLQTALSISDGVASNGEPPTPAEIAAV